MGLVSWILLTRKYTWCHTRFGMSLKYCLSPQVLCGRDGVATRGSATRALSSWSHGHRGKGLNADGVHSMGGLRIPPLCVSKWQHARRNVHHSMPCKHIPETHRKRSHSLDVVFHPRAWGRPRLFCIFPTTWNGLVAANPFGGGRLRRE